MDRIWTIWWMGFGSVSSSFYGCFTNLCCKLSHFNLLNSFYKSASFSGSGGVVQWSTVPIKFCLKPLELFIIFWTKHQAWILFVKFRYYNILKYNDDFIGAITVISGAYEFCKKFNNEIVERDSDEFEIKRLVKDLRHLGDAKKEAPFFLPWSIKARTLLHAYLSRLPLQSERLEKGIPDFGLHT